MQIRYSTCVAMLIAMAQFAPARVHAHATPEGIDLIWPDDGEQPPLILTNRGLVFIDQVDNSPQYSLRCAESYGANTSDRPSVFVHGDVITIGSFDAVYSTKDRACSKTKGAGLTDDTITGIAHTPNARQRMFTATRATELPSLLHVSDDYGATWRKHYESGVGLVLDRLLAAPSDPERMYAATINYDRVNFKVNFYCSASKDGGATWQHQPLPSKMTPFAVHPKRAEIVFAYSPVDKLETVWRVLRSEDGGANFMPVLENVQKPTGLVASERYLWLGIDGEGGLYQSSNDGQSFERVQSELVQSVSCLVYRKGRLWACANVSPNENGIHFSDDEGVSFRKLMSFEQVTQPVLCPDDGYVCARAWYDFDSEIRPRDLDAGAPFEGGLVDEEAVDASALPADDAMPVQPPDAELPPTEPLLDTGPPEPPSTRRRGCQLGQGAPASGHPSVMLFAAALYLTMRRRRAEP